MNKNIYSEKQLIHLKLAYEVHQIADPLVKLGRHSLSEIYYKFVVREVPVCINTFRKMMKEDVSSYPQLAKDYQERVYDQYLRYLKKQSNKRVKKKKLLSLK